MIAALLSLVVFVFFIILAHEAAHILTYRYFKGRWPVIDYEKGTVKVIGSDLTKKQARWFVLNGILTGFFVILAFIDVFNPIIIIGVLIGYMWGCKYDFKALEAAR